MISITRATAWDWKQLTSVAVDLMFADAAACVGCFDEVEDFVDSLRIGTGSARGFEDVGHEGFSLLQPFKGLYKVGLGEDQELLRSIAAIIDSLYRFTRRRAL